MPNDGADPGPDAPSEMPICRSLRSNGMYVFTDGQGAGAADDDDCGSTVYWCLHTMKSFGPDDSMVGRRQCRNAARSCYEPF